MVMEEISRSNPLIQSLSNATFWTGLFATCYLAVLPMASTIALRNVALLGLLIALGWHFSRIKSNFRLGMPVMLWALYLIAFPLFSDDHSTAWQSLGGQWGRGLLAMLAGVGVASILSNKNRGLAFYLGLISSLPILVHLILFIVKAWTTSSIPWGYWGRETHHADLGYAAGQAVILLAAAIAAGPRVLRPWSAALIVACLLSTALANSRAGFAFCVLGGVSVFAAAYLTRTTHRRINFLVGALGVIVVGTIVLAVAIQEDARWRTMTPELVAGFHGDAIQLQCEGTASIEPLIIANHGDQAQRIINSVQYGDGSRVVLFRAGLALALKHPWGSDGSRQAFQKVLRQECANPAITMAHTHDGWLDTILALGWGGASLYLFVLLNFFRQGYLYLRDENGLSEWALVLVVLSTFWMVRGFTDSVLRDHMLEMQGFVLSFALISMRRQKTNLSNSAQLTS